MNQGKASEMPTYCCSGVRKHQNTNHTRKFEPKDNQFDYDGDEMTHYTNDARRSENTKTSTTPENLNQKATNSTTTMR